MSRISSHSSTPEVQGWMNAATTGTSQGWKGKNALWHLLLRVRNSFVKEQLTKFGLNPKELKQLGEIQRYRRIAELEDIFKASFFSYSRDGDWMQQAVGDTPDWIQLDGMAAWHVRAALLYLEKSDEKAAASAPPPPFDAVKDAIEQNTHSAS